MKTAWELGGYWELEITFIAIRVCVCVCVYVQIKCFYVYMHSASPFPLVLTHSHEVRIVFNIAKHETMGYKLAFQPDIFDMISASYLVSLLFVSFLP